MVNLVCEQNWSGGGDKFAWKTGRHWIQIDSNFGIVKSDIEYRRIQDKDIEIIRSELGAYIVRVSTVHQLQYGKHHAMWSTPARIVRERYHGQCSQYMWVRT